jgi:hypothetical protein
MNTRNERARLSLPARAGFLVLALGFTPAPGAAQGPDAASDLPQARALVERHLEAMGGRDAVLARLTGSMTGRFEMPAAGLAGPLTSASRYPDHRVIRIELPGVGEILSGYDGQVLWAMDPFMGPRILEGTERVRDLEQSSRGALVRDPEAVRTMETVALSEVDGQPCHQVRVVWPSGAESLDCYGVETGLLLGTESSTESPMGVIEVETIYQDYREVGGVIMATRTLQRMMGQEQVMTFEGYDPAPPSDDLFALPPAIRALVEGTR